MSPRMYEFAVRNQLIQLRGLAKQAGSPRGIRKAYLRGRRSVIQTQLLLRISEFRERLSPVKRFQTD